MCVCVCGSLKLAGWIHWYLVGCIYKNVWGFYIDIWQVWWNIYVCGFLKLASLSTLIFDRFFLQKKKKKMAGCWKYMYVDLYMLKIWLLAGCGSIYVENMTIGRMQRLYWKCDRWSSCWIWKKKKWLLERNNK